MFNFNPILKKRANAFTIDLAIIIVVNYFLMASFTDFLKIVFFHFPIHTQLTLLHKFKYIHSISLLSLMFSYFTAFYYASNGQTMGKMIMNLRVVEAEGEMTLTSSMKRAITYIGCAWFASLPFLLPLFRKDQKSFADLFSKTSVELIEEKIVEQNTVFQLTLLEAINNETLDESEREEAEYFEQNKAA